MLKKGALVLQYKKRLIYKQAHAAPLLSPIGPIRAERDSHAQAKSGFNGRVGVCDFEDYRLYDHFVNHSSLSPALATIIKRKIFIKKLKFHTPLKKEAEEKR